MKNKKSKDTIMHKVCGLLLEYKKYFPAIFLCLMGISFMTFIQPLIIRRITDHGMIEKDMKCICIFSGVLVGVSLIQQGLNVTQAVLFSNIHNQLTLKLYTRTYWKMGRIRIQYFDEKGSAEIINTIHADINNIATVADQITTFYISSILQIIGGIVGLSLLNWKLALLIILVIPLKFLIIYYFSGKKNHAFEQLIENNRVFSRWFGDCVSGIQEMKLWNLFYVKIKAFERLQHSIMDSYKENIMLDEYKTWSVVFVDAVMNAILYVLSGMLIVKGEFTIGGAFAFITYSGYVVNPISFLINIKYYFAQIKPSAKRLFEFWEQREEAWILDKKESENSFRKRFKNTSVLEMENVVFKYGGDTQVLKGCTFRVYKGEKIAIIGENGSGKSTLLNLLTGFYQPQCGKVKVSGIQVETLGLEEVRKKIAVVSQKPYLFQGSIEENVNIDGRSTHEEVIRACEKSGALEFILKLESGFEQKIGHDGAKISGGERQKLAVARALLKKADILLMDEATSGVDVESSKLLHKLLCNELENITVIFITHRYEELEGINKVYRLTDGVLSQIEIDMKK